MRYRIYVGTYTEEIHFASGKVVKGRGEGIYQLLLDQERERLLLTGEICCCVNPSYLSLDSDGSHMYVANERKESDGIAGGTVSAYKVNRDTGALTLLNRRYTKGTDPCYVTVHPACVYVCNYGSGSIAAYPVARDGSLDEMAQFIQYEGSSVHESRQTGPQAHSMTLYGNENYGLVCNLGTDRIEAYRIDKSGRMILMPESSIASRPGAGPRHQEFSADGRYLYTVTELDSTVSVYRYDQQKQRFFEIQIIATLAADFKGENTCADIHIAPDGSFLYVSNRGNSTIAIYHVDKANGCLALSGHMGSGGEVPRSFAITPDGRHMIAANQNSDNIVLFRVREDGMLEQTDEISIFNPVCVKILCL